MDEATVVSLVKESIGIKTNVRDTIVTAIVKGVIKELEDEKGLKLDKENAYHLIFVVDYATWRYENRKDKGPMPRHLQFRLHNLMVHVGGGT